MFDRDLHTSLGKAKYLAQLQMRRFKKNPPPCQKICFANLFWKIIQTNTDWIRYKNNSCDDK